MNKVVSFAAAGTAGHLEPALAVAKWLRNADSSLICEFVGTDSGLENLLVPEAGFRLIGIPKVAFPRKMEFSVLAWPFKFMKAIHQTSKALKFTSVLVGFGGYVCAPCYLVAWVKRIPILIHEQNAKPGWANRLGAIFTKKITLAFGAAQNTRSFGNSWRTAQVVGMPLRESIIKLSQKNKEDFWEMRTELCSRIGFDPSRPIIVIFGGSLGAKRINDTVAGSIKYFMEQGIQVIHGVGGSNQLAPQSNSSNVSGSAGSGYLALNYLSNMAELYAVADLVISRSGAVTCSELAYVKVFSLLVPLPIGNGEQKLNAQELVARHLAEIIDNSHLTSEWLNQNIERLLIQGSEMKAVRIIEPLEDASKLISQLIEKVLLERVR